MFCVALISKVLVLTLTCTLDPPPRLFVAVRLRRRTLFLYWSRRNFSCPDQVGTFLKESFLFLPFYKLTSGLVRIVDWRNYCVSYSVHLFCSIMLCSFGMDVTVVYNSRGALMVCFIHFRRKEEQPGFKWVWLWGMGKTRYWRYGKVSY